MVDRLVLVNGPPGSGAPALAAELASRLSAPLVSSDVVEELLADAFPAAPTAALGPIARETTWRLVAETPGTVLLESFWHGPRDLPEVRTALARCCAAMVIEIWCDAGPHGEAAPLDVGLTLRVHTDEPVDVAAVAAGILTMAGGYDY